MASRVRRRPERRTHAEVPRWLDTALQGLVFWMGYQRALYPDYHIGESALVGEMSNLISANLRGEGRLFREPLYRTLVPVGKSSDARRADLVITTNDLSHVPKRGIEAAGGLAKHLAAVIEVKRYRAPRFEITGDLKRLAEFKREAEQADTRAFLVVVSEGRRPSKKWVTPQGEAVRGNQDVPRVQNAYYRVRRVRKASASLAQRPRKKGKLRHRTGLGGAAHYALVLEVFAS